LQRAKCLVQKHLFLGCDGGWPGKWQNWPGTEPEVHQEGNRLAGAIVAGGNDEGEDVGAEVVGLVAFAIVPAPFNLVEKVAKVSLVARPHKLARINHIAVNARKASSCLSSRALPKPLKPVPVPPPEVARVR